MRKGYSHDVMLILLICWRRGATQPGNSIGPPDTNNTHSLVDDESMSHIIDRFVILRDSSRSESPVSRVVGMFLARLKSKSHKKWLPLPLWLTAC